MNRKSFIRLLAAVPVMGVPFRTIARQPGHQTSCKTQKDAEGPFYKAAAPLRSVIEKDGDTLVIEGKVLNGDDCRTPVADAILDVWHCNNHGRYDMEGYMCRGKVKTDAAGKYSFTTIFPPPYGNRPRHIHFKITAAGHRQLTTQLYFKGDPNIRNDFARNAEEDRVIALLGEKDFKKGVFDIYL